MVTMEKPKRKTAPVFEMFSIDQLVDLTPYSEVYLKDMMMRPERIRPMFRKVVSRSIGMSEEKLFGKAA